MTLLGKAQEALGAVSINAGCWMDSDTGHVKFRIDFYPLEGEEPHDVAEELRYELQNALRERELKTLDLVSDHDIVGGSIDWMYPEHQKLRALRCPGSPEDPYASHNELVGNFIEWLRGNAHPEGDGGLVLAYWRPDQCTRCWSRWTPICLLFGNGRPVCAHCGAPEHWKSDSDVLLTHHESTESLLARYFGIDRNRLDKEKREMLQAIRDA